MKLWIQDYLRNYERIVAALPGEKIEALIEIFRKAWENDRRIFVFGNGGSAANASHFVTDLGKGSSDKLSKRFHVLSINDNTPWLTAIGNDYSFEDIYVRQLMNYAQPGDILYTMSVSGNSPNLVKAVQWGNEHGMETIALLSQKQGKLAGIARHVVTVEDDHYGRVEDAHMTISHMICYAFMEGLSATSS
jgi:D-sedoheptulose 7-phosphate isomerase